MKQLSYLFILLFTMAFVSSGSAQTPHDLSPPLSVDIGPPAGQTVLVALTLTNSTGTTVDAIKFKFSFPTEFLTFVGVSTDGTMTQGWTQIDGQINDPDNAPGVITIVGIDLDGTDQSGVLLNVEFETTSQSGVGLLQLTDFEDDLTAATTTDGTLNSTVPVELASFSARVSGNTVALKWLTVSETNNFGFDVERSLDAETFAKIGFVQGHGTTTTEQRYEFIDEDVQAGKRYYRLKQIDVDGAFEYSSTLEVDISAPKSFVLAQNYPNPFNPATAIQFSVPVASEVNITVYDALGRAIRELVNETYAPGTHSITWDGRDNSGERVASGVYFYAVKAGTFHATRKMILLQ